MTRTVIPKTTINFLWVGSPTLYNPRAVSGHDVAGPIKMGKEGHGNLIKFWCLAEHKEFYEAEFARHQVQIEVCTIESLLESQAQNGDIATFIHYLNQKLNDLKKPDDMILSCVEFKDDFSFLILAAEGGYFLDTNVFPMFEQKVVLQGESRVTAAYRRDGGPFDFYFMYSPEAWHIKILEPMKKFKEGGFFNGHEYFEKPFLDCEEQGIRKYTYRSHINSSILPGLFSFLRDSPKDLEENLPYGDINLQIINNPWHIFLVSNFSLYEDKKSISHEEILKLPLSSNEGYVLSSDGIYYVNKNNQYIGFFYSGAGVYSHYFIYFSKASLSNILMFAPKLAVDFLVNFPEQHNKQFPATPFYIEHMVNTGGCTLLHHAVVLNKPEHIDLLLKKGARLDLKAKYRHITGISTEEQVELTPEELATRLDRKEVSEIFAKWRELKPNPPISCNTSTIFCDTKTKQSFSCGSGCSIP